MFYYLRRLCFAGVIVRRGEPLAHRVPLESTSRRSRTVRRVISADVSVAFVLAALLATSRLTSRVPVNCFVDIDSTNFLSATDRLTRGPTLENRG
jgi:hypothetical protein